MATQVAGFTSANLAEVEANTRAIRTTPKPIDWGALGIYGVGGLSGTIGAAIAANSIVFSFRWGNASNLGILKKIKISAGNTVTAFAAGVLTFNLFRTTSFTVADTTGATALTPSKLRSTMGASLVSSVGIANTGAITAGTGTDDASALASMAVAIPATAGATMVVPVDLFVAGAGDYPLVMAQNEGFRLRVATIPGTGTWALGVSLVWEELASYVP